MTLAIQLVIGLVLLVLACWGCYTWASKPDEQETQQWERLPKLRELKARWDRR